MDDMATAPPMTIAGTGREIEDQTRYQRHRYRRDCNLHGSKTEDMLPEPYELLEREFQAKREQQQHHSDLANAAKGSVFGNQAEAGGSNDYTGKNVTDNAGHADP